MAQPVIVFKVALSGRKSIWRRIAVRGSQTLGDLHEAIFDAFEREDEHLYSFYFPRSGGKKSGRNLIRDSVEYSCPLACQYNVGPFSDGACRNSAETTFDSLKLEPKQVFHYFF